MSSRLKISLFSVWVSEDASLAKLKYEAGAGLYSFFDNYTQSCITTRNCQSQMVDIDSDSQIVMYSLSTVSSTFQISLDGKGVVNQADNINGFASTVTAWTPC